MYLSTYYILSFNYKYYKSRWSSTKLFVYIDKISLYHFLFPPVTKVIFFGEK